MSETAFVDTNHRPMGIATDDANANFAGARDPDSALFVQFYTKPVQNNFLTLKEGRPIFEDRLMIHIEIPGNRNSIIDTFATEGHKRRFYRQWAYYQAKHAADAPEMGTPLSQWAFLAPARVEELKALGFRSVEQVAAASDQNIKNIGMAAGIDAFAFRERAKRYLQAAAGDAAVQNTAAENEKLLAALEAEKKAREDAEAAHKQEMAELRALISQATAQSARRGRPPKAKAVSG